jgi:asparagine synthase (glutamine-hydrolysing)
VSGAFVVDAAPFEWASGALALRACERARAWGADVILTGAWGDEVLDGDPARFAERAREGDWRVLVDAARFVEPVRSTPAGRVARLVLRPMIRPFIPERILRHRLRRGVRQHAAWGWGGDRVRALLESSQHADGREARFASQATSAWLADLADGRAQIELGAGCDRVDPYLDREFVAFMASLPPDALFYGRRTRGLFCHAMRGIIPDSVRLRPDKASWEVAIDELVAGMGGIAAFDSLLSMEATADLGLINPRPFRAAFEAQARGEASKCGWIDVWPAVAVEAFVRASGGAADREASDRAGEP